MSAKTDYLQKHGWVRTSRRKMGMVVIERWSKPGTDWQGVSQGVAYQLARDTEKWEKRQAAERIQEQSQ